jgi:integrase
MQQVEAEQLRLFDVGPNMAQLREELAALRNFRRSEATHIAYDCDWRRFESWCVSTGRQALPATSETIALYVVARLQEGRKVTTVERGVAAIAYHHRQAGLKVPDRKEEVWPLLNAAQRKRKEQPRRRTPLMPDVARKICRALVREGTPLAVRDRALLTLGLATALRANNLAALTLQDIQFVPRKGFEVHVRSSKTDQTGVGKVLGVRPGVHEETCPVKALKDWLAIRETIRDAARGPLFIRVSPGDAPHLPIPINKQTVNTAVKRCVKSIGLDASTYGAHSLRAGFVTFAKIEGADLLDIMERTGHRSIEMVSQYFRNSDPFAGRNPVGTAL